MIDFNLFTTIIDADNILDENFYTILNTKIKKLAKETDTEYEDVLDSFLYFIKNGLKTHNDVDRSYSNLMSIIFSPIVKNKKCILDKKYSDYNIKINWFFNILFSTDDFVLVSYEYNEDNLKTVILKNKIGVEYLYDNYKLTKIKFIDDADFTEISA